MHFNFKVKLFDPAWFDDFILSKVLVRYSFTEIAGMTFKRVMQVYSSIMRLQEWEQAREWYNYKRQEIESKFTKNGQKMVNKESIISDHLNQEQDDIALFLLGGLKK